MATINPQLLRISDALHVIVADGTLAELQLRLRWNGILAEHRLTLKDPERRTSIFRQLIDSISEHPSQLWSLFLSRAIQSSENLADRVELASLALGRFETESDRSIIARIFQVCDGGPIWDESVKSVIKTPLRSVLISLAGNQTTMERLFQAETDLASTDRPSKLYLLGCVIHYTIYQQNSAEVQITDSVWQGWLLDKLTALDQAVSQDTEIAAIYLRYLRDLVRMVAKADYAPYLSWLSRILPRFFQRDPIHQSELVSLAIDHHCAKVLQLLIASRCPITARQWREIVWHSWPNSASGMVAQIIDAKLEGQIVFDSHDLFRRILSITSQLDLVQVARIDPSACSYFHHDLVAVFQRLIIDRSKDEIDRLLEYFTELECKCAGWDASPIHAGIIPINARGDRLIAELTKMCQEEEMREDALQSLAQYTQRHSFRSRYYLIQKVFLIANQWELESITPAEPGRSAVRSRGVPVIAIPLDDTEISSIRAARIVAMLTDQQLRLDEVLD